MQTLTLFPTDKNNKLGLLYGVGATALGGYLVFLNGDFQFNMLGIIAMAGGAWTALRAVLQISNPRPVFVADAEGFSVKGKAKRPWTEYRGASVYRVSTGIFSVSKSVRIKVGKSMLGGTMQLNQLHLSDTAERMAMTIELFAQEMKAGAKMSVLDKYGLPPEQAAANVQPARPTRPAVPEPAAIDFGAPTPQPAFAQRMQPSDGGPVQSTPRLSERLFGRRKVL